MSNENITANQDNLLAIALFMKDYVKAETVVNRAKHIGEHGITYNPEKFKEHKHAIVALNIFDEDKNINNFEI